MAVEISTPEELDAMRLDVTGSYQLVNDIDMSGFGNWVPCGDAVTASFSGTLNGMGHIITNLVIGVTPGQSQRRALFGSLTGTVLDLGVSNYSFSSTATFRSGSIGGASGSASSVTRCWATAASNIVQNGYYIGGILGTGSSLNPITDCWCRANLTLATYSGVEGNPWSGGIVGTNCVPLRCFYAGEIQRVAGEPDPPGGVSGDASVQESFFDSDLAIDVQADLKFGIPKTTAEMKNIDTYTAASWDIVEGYDPTYTWGMHPTINDGYPFLQVFHQPLPTPTSQTTTEITSVSAVVNWASG